MPLPCTTYTCRLPCSSPPPGGARTHQLPLGEDGPGADLVQYLQGNRSLPLARSVSGWTVGFPQQAPVTILTCSHSPSSHLVSPAARCCPSALGTVVTRPSPSSSKPLRVLVAASSTALFSGCFLFFSPSRFQTTDVCACVTFHWFQGCSLNMGFDSRLTEESS